MNEKIELCRNFRTVHSISDNDINKILHYINSEQPKTFLDFGCHLGHLSILLALGYNMEIFAVDNFVGSFGDELMFNTIKNITNGGGNFKYKLIENIESTKSNFLGNITVVESTDFLELKNEEIFDMAFIDSSHGEEDLLCFKKIFSLTKSGGIISGHDNCGDFPLVISAINSIAEQCEMLSNEYTWFMRKK